MDYSGDDYYGDDVTSGPATDEVADREAARVREAYRLELAASWEARREATPVCPHCGGRFYPADLRVHLAAIR